MPIKMSAIYLFTFIFISCASIPVYRVNSLENSKYYLMGRETIIKKDNDINVILNFENQSGKELIFYLVVENNSLKSITIDPSKIYAEILDSPDASNSSKKIYAVEPENELVRVDKEINQVNANKQTADGINFIVATLDLASSTAGIFEKKSEEQINREYSERMERKDNMERDEEEYNEDINKLNQNKKYWEDEVLRITTLKTEERIGGFFHLQIYPETDYFNLVIPIGHKEFKFH